MTEHVDVAVIGGGPGGATTAALLAQRGHQVLLLERQKFPRYHIGESLVPGVIPVLEELGLSEKIEEYGFVRKHGISLVWGTDGKPWSVYFGEAGGYDHVWQVTRADFDNLLLQHARHSGATVLEEARVTDVHFDGPRCTGLSYRLARSDEPHEVTADMVVDASGQSHLLAREQDMVEWEPELQNVAVWSYFQGGTGYEGRQSGNILVENTPDGWLWVIPLQDGTRSVGWVTPLAHARDRDESLGELLESKIATSDETSRLLDGARRVAPFHTTKDWSYKCTRFQGPGYMLVGDAAGFVDPLFSTGVFLAMNAASLAASKIEGILAEPARAEQLGADYERGYREFLDVVLSFVHYFYDPTRAKESYWERAGELVDPIKEMTARQDFIYLISGLAGSDGILGQKRTAELAGAPA
jgi:FAD-dependent halogenase